MRIYSFLVAGKFDFSIDIFFRLCFCFVAQKTSSNFLFKYYLNVVLWRLTIHLITSDQHPHLQVWIAGFEDWPPLMIYCDESWQEGWRNEWNSLWIFVMRWARDGEMRYDREEIVFLDWYTLIYMCTFVVIFGIILVEYYDFFLAVSACISSMDHADPCF